MKNLKHIDDEQIACKSHPGYKYENCPICELAIMKAQNQDLSNLIQEMRDVLQEIFANYGENKDIDTLCSPLIDKTRYR